MNAANIPTAPGEEFEPGDMIGLNADGQAVNLSNAWRGKIDVVFHREPRPFDDRRAGLMRKLFIEWANGAGIQPPQHPDARVRIDLDGPHPKTEAVEPPPPPFDWSERRIIVSKRLEAAPIKPHEGGYVLGEPFFMDCFTGAISGIMEKLWVDAANDALAPPPGPIDYSIGIASIAEPDADTPHIVNG